MSLPILDQVSVASPCHVAWESMHGDDRTRFCDSCSKRVYNLSGMTRADAEALVVSCEGKICIRFFRRHDGTMLTADCPVGLARVRRRMALVAAGVVAIVASVAGAAFGAMRNPRQCATGGTKPLSHWVQTAWNGPQPNVPVAGLIAMPTPTATPAVAGKKKHHP